MLGCLRSLVGKVAILLMLVLAAYAGWQWGPSVFPRVHEWFGLGPAQVQDSLAFSPAVADSALASVQAFRRGRGGDRMALGGRELTSLLRYSVSGMIPEGVADPSVTLRDDRVHFGGKVALDAFPDLPDLGPMLGILPDTLAVVLEATLLPFGEKTAALLVHGVEASRVPLPRRLIPEILRGMGRVDQPGLPPEAITIPLPSGLGSAYILADSLILTHDP